VHVHIVEMSGGTIFKVLFITFVKSCVCMLFFFFFFNIFNCIAVKKLTFNFGHGCFFFNSLTTCEILWKPLSGVNISDIYYLL